MKKALLLLIVGIAVGYWLGFNDAQSNSEDIVTRLVNATGGSTRNTIGSKANVDRLADSLARN